MIKKKSHLENDYLKKQAKKERERKKLEKALERERLDVERRIREQELNIPSKQNPKRKKYKKKHGKTGIYQILNLISGKSYVGQSINLASRKSQHFSKLRKGSHPKTELQKDFKELGESNFKFNILEYCDKTQLEELEIKWHNKLKNKGLYSKFSKWILVPFDKLEEVKRILNS